MEKKNIHKVFTFKNQKMLYIEKIEIQSIINPVFITTKSNSLFISSYNTDSIIYVYSIPDLIHKNTIGVKGYGPEDFLDFAMFYGSTNEYLYIYGNDYDKLNKYSITSQKELELKSILNIHNEEYMNQPYIFNDSILIYNALPADMAIKKYNIEKQAIPDEIRFKNRNYKNLQFTSDRGYVAANDSFIIYSYLYKKQIDIYYTHNMKLKKRIVGKYKKQKIDIKNPNNNKRHYVNLVVGKKFMYALYKIQNDIPSPEYILEIYDYEGNPIIEYHFDLPPLLFCIDEKEEYLYGYRHDEPNQLLRYKL
ncbi:MAG: hypothetical protein LIP06_05585 [Tannerellaceae bacterium]|nr:hypothetical protein [Tannerellaceae bacterium]